MRYTLVVISLLANFIYAQCDHSSESQCSSNSNCEWVEDISYGNCWQLSVSECLNYPNQCYVDSEPGWYDSSGPYCTGGTYQIDNSYCQEVEAFECSDMNQLQCNQDDSCGWVDDTSSGWCGGFQTYTSCSQYDDCSWDYVCVQFHHLYDTMCVDYDYVCTGGTWTSDNSYCEETEELECSTMDELQCDQDSSCSWVNDLDSGNCWNYNNSNSCNSNDNCNWTSYQQACTGTGYTDCISQNPACSYSWLEYTCTGSYTVSYCGGGSYEIDNGYCEETTPTVFLSIAGVDITNGIIYIDMTNDEDVGGFQLLLSDSPNNISITGAGSGVAEEVGFSISSNESGVVVAFSFTGDVIPSGNHTLLEYYFDIENQDLTTLCIDNIVFSDPNGFAMTAVSSDCFETSLEDFYIGDANGDGILNVLDIVMIVNIILNSEYDFSSDYNQDGVVNVLDVVGIMNEIMEN